MYRNLPSKCPWALEIHGPKNGVGVYMEEPFVHTCITVYTRTIGSSKNGGGRLHGDGCLLGRIRYMYNAYTNPLPLCITAEYEQKD